MAGHAGRRPYRVLFTPGPRSGPGMRRGVIVPQDEAGAHREARSVADAGGRAEVLYVGGDGRSQVVAVYPAEGDA